MKEPDCYIPPIVFDPRYQGAQIESNSAYRGAAKKPTPIPYHPIKKKKKK